MKTTYSMRLVYVSSFLILIMTGCNKNPKVITANTNNTNESTGIFTDEVADQPELSIGEDVHTVTVLEALPTNRYVYLRVKEGQDEFWIATIKMEVTIGGSYFYRDGLLKTNFESKEYNRVFDRMFLVSSLVKADHGTQSAPTDVEETKPVDVKGSVKIADLVANPKKYDGKIIQISGKCVKINANIMGRNWVHLQDGSRNDYDLVITCDVQIPVGHTITMTGKVVLNKDFGSGYQYAILLEEGELVR